MNAHAAVKRIGEMGLGVIWLGPVRRRLRVSSSRRVNEGEEATVFTETEKVTGWLAMTVIGVGGVQVADAGAPEHGEKETVPLKVVESRSGKLAVSPAETVCE